MSRNVWSDRPLGVKLAALVGRGRRVPGGLRRRSRCRRCRAPGRRADELLASAEATEDVLLEADMMHDAVRGDVLQALVSGGPGRLYDGGASPTWPSTTRSSASILAEVVADDLGAEVDAAVDEVTPAVEAYLASAAGDRHRGRDATRRAAEAAYPQFAEAFAVAGGRAAHLGDAVAALRRGRRRGQRGAARAPRSPSWSSSPPPACCVLGLLGWVITRSVVRPLRRVGAVLAGLADGDLRGTAGVDQPGRGRPDGRRARDLHGQHARRS